MAQQPDFPRLAASFQNITNQIDLIGVEIRPVFSVYLCVPVSIYLTEELSDIHMQANQLTAARVALPKDPCHSNLTQLVLHS